jgi:hypothetical protein
LLRLICIPARYLCLSSEGEVDRDLPKPQASPSLKCATFKLLFWRTLFTSRDMLTRATMYHFGSAKMATHAGPLSVCCVTVFFIPPATATYGTPPARKSQCRRRIA